MTHIVLGPVLTLYSLAFYRRVGRQRLGRGLGYLVYLSSLYSTAIAIALLAFWLPAADRFVDWLADASGRERGAGGTAPRVRPGAANARGARPLGAAGGERSE